MGIDEGREPERTARGAATGPEAPPGNDPEAARIRAVYAGYRRYLGERAKWDARNPGNRCMWDEFTRTALRALGDADVKLAEATVLDIGCGFGSVLGWLADSGGTPRRLFGIDLLEDRAAEARGRYPGIHFAAADARFLPFPDQVFDLVLCINLFGSILDDAGAALAAAQARRVLKPAGTIVWCDLRYRNPWNANVRGYGRAEIGALFPGFRPVTLQSITPLPPFLRRLGRAAPLVYPFVAAVPPLRVRYLAAMQPGPET